MPRLSNAVSSRKRRKRRLRQARGFYGARHRQFRTATEAVDKAMQHAYVGRKQKKRQYRQLWIVRISAACKPLGISYSRLMDGLSKANIELNRKMLSEIAIHDVDGFRQIVQRAQNALG